jgi:hypothetical protein
MRFEPTLSIFLTMVKIIMDIIHHMNKSPTGSTSNETNMISNHKKNKCSNSNYYC